jgi:hypothetical protein
MVPLPIHGTLPLLVPLGHTDQRVGQGAGRSTSAVVRPDKRKVVAVVVRRSNDEPDLAPRTLAATLAQGVHPLAVGPSARRPGAVAFHTGAPAPSR